MVFKSLSTNTYTYTYPLRRLDITALYNTITQKMQQSGVRTSVGYAAAAGAWQGIGGENRVISIVERGLFSMFVTVCYTQKHVQVQICYSPQLKTKFYADPARAMRYSQWDMCIYSTFDAIRSSLKDLIGEPILQSEESIEQV